MAFSLPLSPVVDLNISSQSCDFANNMTEFLGSFVQLVLGAVIDTDAFTLLFLQNEINHKDDRAEAAY